MKLNQTKKNPLNPIKHNSSCWENYKVYQTFGIYVYVCYEPRGVSIKPNTKNCMQDEELYVVESASKIKKTWQTNCSRELKAFSLGLLKKADNKAFSLIAYQTVHASLHYYETMENKKSCIFNERVQSQRCNDLHNRYVPTSHVYKIKQIFRFWILNPTVWTHWFKGNTLVSGSVKQQESSNRMVFTTRITFNGFSWLYTSID